jgi:hypothetical protein
MTRRGIRMFAQNENLKFDDNISCRCCSPILPAWEFRWCRSCRTAPFLRSRPYRCYAVGEALGDFIRNDLPSDMRVALLGSGGLSHEPGGARYYFIDEVFDRWFLDLVSSATTRNC